MDRTFTVENFLDLYANNTDLNFRAWPVKSSFLALPSELRQQILPQTFDAAHPTPISLLDERNWGLGQWVGALMRVHADIADDVRYVVGKWESIFEVMVNEQYKRVDQKSDRITEI